MYIEQLLFATLIAATLVGCGTVPTAVSKSAEKMPIAFNAVDEVHAQARAVKIYAASRRLNISDEVSCSDQPVPAACDALSFFSDTSTSSKTIGGVLATQVCEISDTQVASNINAGYAETLEEVSEPPASGTITAALAKRRTSHEFKHKTDAEVSETFERLSADAREKIASACKQDLRSMFGTSVSAVEVKGGARLSSRTTDDSESNSTPAPPKALSDTVRAFAGLAADAYAEIQFVVGALEQQSRREATQHYLKVSLPKFKEYLSFVAKEVDPKTRAEAVLVARYRLMDLMLAVTAPETTLQRQKTLEVALDAFVDAYAVARRDPTCIVNPPKDGCPYAAAVTVARNKAFNKLAAALEQASTEEPNIDDIFASIAALKKFDELSTARRTAWTKFLNSRN